MRMTTVCASSSVNNEGGGPKGPYAYNKGHDASQIPNDTEGIGNRHVKGAGIIGFDARVHCSGLLGGLHLNP